MIKKLTITIIMAMAVFIIAPNIAIAQLTVSSAKAQNLVVEQPNGLLSTTSSSADISSLVATTNAARLKKYQNLAKTNGLSIGQVQSLAGAKLMGK